MLFCKFAKHSTALIYKNITFGLYTLNFLYSPVKKFYSMLHIFMSILYGITLFANSCRPTNSAGAPGADSGDGGGASETPRVKRGR